MRFLNLDNPFLQKFSLVIDIAWLNLLWLVCSLPLITFGPSTAALHYVLMRVIAGDDTELTKHFFASFRRNFRQGLILGLLVLAVGALLLVDVIYYIYLPGSVTNIGQVLQLVLVLLYLMTVVWVFGLLAKLEMKLTKIISSACFLSVRYAGYTFMMLVCDISFLALAFVKAPVLALWGVGFTTWVNCICIRSVLTKYYPQLEEERQAAQPQEDSPCVPQDVPDGEKKQEASNGY